MKIKIVFSVSENCRASADLLRQDGSFVRNFWNHRQLYANRTYTEYIDDTDNLPQDDYKLRLTTNNIKSYWEGVIGNTAAKLTGPSTFYNMEQTKDMDAGNSNYFYATGYNEGKTSCWLMPRANRRAGYPIFDKRGMNAMCVCVKNGIVYWAGIDPYEKKSWADEFAERFIDNALPLKDACKGFPDYTEEKMRKCVHVYIDVNDLFAGYRVNTYTKKDFVAWFEQYILRAEWCNTLSGIWATRESDNTEIDFLFGETYAPYAGRTFKSMVMYRGDLADVTGLSVSDKFIYVSYGGLSWGWNSRDVISVFNLEGRKVNDFEVSKPGKSIVVDDYLFYCSGNKVCRACLDSDGGISQDIEKEINGSFTVLDVSYYKVTGLISVASTDGSIRYFTKDLEFVKQVGANELYWSNPVVFNDKFYWEDIRNVYECFICTDNLNGLQLIGDGGNNRIQVFDKNFVFKETISWLSTSYQVGALGNRIFCEHLEFSRDYSYPQKLMWKLEKNWGCYADNEFVFIDMPFELRGKTYARQQGYKLNMIRLVELDPDVGIVLLNEVILPSNIAKDKALIYPDGSIYMDESKPGKYIKISKRQILGIDENGFFEWAAPVVILISEPSTPKSTYPNLSKRFFETIDNNLYIYNASRTEDKCHLNRINIEDGKFVDYGFPSTHKGYYGEYIDDMFDIGNSVLYPGGIYIARDKFLICNYHGEFWAGGQVNKWHLFDKNLVSLHTYGIDYKTIKKQGLAWPAAKMAGNSFSGNFIKQGDYFYLYHCDEGHHAGIHSVRFEGMDTVKTLEFSASLYDENAGPFYVYPLIGLPKYGPINNGDAGWNLYPESTYNTGSSDIFTVEAGRKYLSKIEPSDLFVGFKGIKKSVLAWYDIDPVTSSKWSLTGQINFEGNYHSRDKGKTNLSKFHIVDETNSEIFKLWTAIDYSTKIVTLYINDIAIFQLPEFDAEKILDYYRPFSIWCNNSIITAKYHNYPIVNLGITGYKPTKIMIAMMSSGSTSLACAISLKSLKFTRR